MITDAQLQKIMPTLNAGKRAVYLPPLNAAMQANAIGTSMLRAAAFLAQIAHESGELRWMEEIWGPTAAQLRYEPPSDLAARLGNTQPGDGKLFKGRGPIQITGRANYAKYGQLLQRDLTGQPSMAATPDVAFATAGLFWSTNGLNALADTQDFITITKRINGGTNGLSDRQMYYERAKAALATGFTPDAVSRGAAGVSRLRGVPLTRGHELIVRSERALRAAATRTKAASESAATASSRKRPAHDRSTHERPRHNRWRREKA